MLQYEYIEDDHTLTDIQTSTPTDTQTNTQANTQEDAKKNKEKDVTDQESNWMDFFKTPTELDVDEMFIKPTKQNNVFLKTTQKDETLLIPTQDDIKSAKQETELFLKPTQKDDIMLHKSAKKDTNNMYLKPKKHNELFLKPTQDEMLLKPTQNDIPNSPKQDKPKKHSKSTAITIKQEMDTETDFEEKIDTDIKNLQSILQVPSEILNQPSSVKKRIVKYIDPITGKIYYLEMDRELDLTKVQEIIINNTTTKISPIKSNGLKNVRKKKGISLLKPEVKHQLKAENSIRVDRIKLNFPHLENDHCYITNPRGKCLEVIESEVKMEENLYDRLVSVMPRYVITMP